jgi:hypothetical protein
VVGVVSLRYTANMGSTVLLAEAAEAIDTIGNGLDALFASGMSPADDRDAIVWITELETLSRRVAAAQTGLLDVIDRKSLFAADGHASAKVIVRHHAKLSEGDAKARVQVAAVCRDLPEVAEAWQAGQVGASQMRVIGEVHANPRVRPEMEERQQRLLDDARLMSARRFAQTTRGWARLVDQDGPQPAGERCHERRDSKLIPDPIDSSWTLSGSFGSLQGVEMREILDHFIDAEFKVDWAEAKQRVGERVTKADLERTDAQRRADAMLQLFRDAAAAPEGAVPPGFVHNIHWSAESYEELLQSLAGNRAPHPDPDTHMCRTPDGFDVDPTEAATNSLLFSFRRMVVDAKGVVIDLGRARRFTGSARTAASGPYQRCVWPGCWVQVTACEIDHVTEHAKGGGTDPTNGIPLCGRHNRWKQKGFTVHREHDGTWRLTRPDGTQAA